jgi:cobalt/nickel transport system permease protein
MNSNYFDPYRPGSSVIHRLDVRVKLVTTVILILGCTIVPVGAWSIYAVFFSLSITVALLSELGIRFFWLRALLAVPFLLSAVPLLATVKGEIWHTINLGFINIPITYEGIDRFISIVLKAWISIQFAIALVATTPFPHLIGSMSAIGVPRILVLVIGLMWRYLFIFADEASRLVRARDARSGLPYKMRHNPTRLIWRAQVTGGMVGNLLLRALDRADKVYAAMLVRGYDGTPRSMALPPLKLRHWVFMLGVLLCFTLLLIMGVFIN